MNFYKIFLELLATLLTSHEIFILMSMEFFPIAYQSHPIKVVLKAKLPEEFLSFQHEIFNIQRAFRLMIMALSKVFI